MRKGRRAARAGMDTHAWIGALGGLSVALSILLLGVGLLEGSWLLGFGLVLLTNTVLLQAALGRTHRMKLKTPKAPERTHPPYWEKPEARPPVWEKKAS